MKLATSKLYASDLVVGVLFLITPLWSLPFTIFQLFKTKRGFYTFLISVFFGLTASLLAPTGDLYRLYIIFFDFQNTSLKGLFSFISLKPDSLFYIILFLFAKIGLSLRILIFGVVFGYFQLSFRLLRNQNPAIKISVILLFVMQFDFLLQGLFLRFPLAMLIVIFAFVRKIEGKSLILFWLIIASMIHFAALVAIPLYFMTRISQNKLQKYLIYSLFIMPFGSYIFIFLTTHFIELFPDIPLKLKLQDYFLGYWALEYFEERTWKALVQFYSERALYVVILLYFILTKNKGKYRHQAIPFLIMINVLFSFPNLFSRYSVLALFFGLLTIVNEHRKTSMSKILKVSLIVLIPMVFSIRLVAQQKNIRAGYIPEIVYRNAISLSFKKYDKQWIEKNIDKETARPKNIKSL
ncbi:EpsG family protein [Lutimonas zeaxanthinifaciens]|uniref:EpsG family protein n=1 Tax=Lutimonas zeaxanthinifaciens TaxID=3060215 RepID=UPI00265D2572|nr:EpsG family protein [Lutimonas sp. YSD2104]WKK66709.1 EpsG family protein [Lutimonas sp. YSD2104]